LVFAIKGSGDRRPLQKKSLIMRYNLKMICGIDVSFFVNLPSENESCTCCGATLCIKQVVIQKFVRRPVWFISKQWPNDTTINPSHAKFFCTSENGNYGGMLVTLAHGPCWQKLRTGVVCQFNYLRMFLVLLPSYILPYFY